MTSLLDVRLERARHAALEQRARLLQALWCDLGREQRSVRHDALPACLASAARSGCEPLQTYAADLICCADGVWRVARDDTGQHPGAALLEAPLLAVFLPHLCRLLLGETLHLPSVPVHWLGDIDTRRIFQTPARQPWVRDGLTPDSERLVLARLPVARRTRLQLTVSAAPHRFVAGFDAYTDVQHVSLDTAQSFVTH